MTELCSRVQGAIFGYTQSDEISILLQDWATLQTDAWFGYNVAKIASVSASIATRSFNQYIISTGRVGRWAEFDSRCFNIPLAEVTNYFVWRAKDWYRNSVTMFAQKYFSHKELFNKSCSDMHEMLHKLGLNWSTDIDEISKNGLFVWKKIDNTTLRSTWYRDDSVRPNFEAINSRVVAALPQEGA
jgi:tRNA(His) 5'-end guanylyltransferase